MAAAPVGGDARNRDARRTGQGTRPRKKHPQGRAPPPRAAHALTALRCLVDGDYPLRYHDDAEPIDVDYIDHGEARN
jgi:hypothetical protein